MCLGIPGKVVMTYSEHDVLMGKVDFGGVSKRVCLEHVPSVRVGEYVLVHVGFALSKIDEAEANHVFEFLAKMNQLDELDPDGVEPPPGFSEPTVARKSSGIGANEVHPREMGQREIDALEISPEGLKTGNIPAAAVAQSIGVLPETGVPE